jgi:hypothetical protein
VVDPCVEHRIQGCGQVVAGLPRRAVDQIQADLADPSGAGLRRRGHRPTWGVHPVEHGQHVRRGALHPERHPGVASRGDPCEELG